MKLSIRKFRSHIHPDVTIGQNEQCFPTESTWRGPWILNPVIYDSLPCILPDRLQAQISTFGVATKLKNQPLLLLYIPHFLVLMLPWCMRNKLAFIHLSLICRLCINYRFLEIGTIAMNSLVTSAVENLRLPECEALGLWLNCVSTLI